MTAEDKTEVLIERELYWTMRRLYHKMRGAADGRDSQKRVLAIILRRGGISQKELTDMLGIAPGSMSELLGKLDGAGLTKRKTSSSDRRTADIFLTEQGKEQALKSIEEREKYLRELYSILSQEEKEQLLSLLGKLEEDWQRKFGSAQEMPRRAKEADR